eukprot:631497-Rhodomonas_salina.1
MEACWWTSASASNTSMLRRSLVTTSSWTCNCAPFSSSHSKWMCYRDSVFFPQSWHMPEAPPPLSLLTKPAVGKQLLLACMKSRFAASGMDLSAMAAPKCSHPSPAVSRESVLIAVVVLRSTAALYLPSYLLPCLSTLSCSAL